jgi:hypothetical protein
MKRIIFKNRLSTKPKKSRRRVRYIKDRAIRNFLLEHLTPVKIDFSKIHNCLLNQLSKDENAFEKIFPEISDSEGKANSKSTNELTHFECRINFEEKW